MEQLDLRGDGLKKLTRKEVLSRVDHTCLKPTATDEDIRLLCREALEAQTASVCVPPCYVPLAVACLDGKLPVCTVVGFPNGYHTTAVKAAEAEEAIGAGAAEIDMVINIGWAKGKNPKKLELFAKEIRHIKECCHGNLLKVIIETCYLTTEEKILLCRAVGEGGADFIKTSTGFGPAGADLADIELFKTYCPPNVKIKAAGGIRDFATAEQFILAGCSRIGSSNLANLCKK